MIFWDNIKSFSTLYEKLSEPVREQHHLTQMEFDILMFLHNDPQYCTASDIVRIRRITKSHVSASVSSLVEKGLLERSHTEKDRKSIRLKLTPAAAEIVSAGTAVQTAYSEILSKGF